MPEADRHAAKSDLERAICTELTAQGMEHEHRSLHFRVRDPAGRVTSYDPDIVVRRGAIVFLIEPVTEATDAGRIALMAQFLEQHSPELVLVAVAPASIFERLPADAYDERYDVSDLMRIVRRIREQNPDDIIVPFRKDRAT